MKKTCVKCGQPFHTTVNGVRFCSVVCRFLSKADAVNEFGPWGECWRWLGGVVGGYGEFWLDGRMQKAHRVSWLIFRGDIPFHESPHGLCVCHSCDTPLCVNPEHLFLGTNKENAEDREKKGRTFVPRGDKHGRRKLTAQTVQEVRKAYATGRYSQTELARIHRVSQSCISSLVRGETWR